MDLTTDIPAAARLAAIVNSSDDAIVGHDLNGIITDWNRAAERLFGYPAAEAVGQHISLLALQGSESEIAELLSRIRHGESLGHFEAKRRRKDGGIVDVSLTISPIHDENGHVIGISKIARDLSKQKGLHGEEGLLAAIVNASDDAIISKDLDGIVTSWNAAAERLLGYTAAEILGRHITTIAPPDRKEEMAGILARIRRGERVEHFETKRRHKDGSIVDISLTVSPIYDRSGRIVGASKIARDIAERHRAEERLRLLLRELDHRAKNVLAVAQAMLRLTRADTVPDFVSAVEGRIQALARVHSQVAENRWDGAELRTLVAAEIDVFSERGGRMQAEGPPVFVSPAAAQVLGIVLHELSTNAAKHGALSVDSGLIKIRWQLGAAGNLHIAWIEQGGAAARPPERRGFGAQVIERSVPDQLGGTAEIKWLPTGLECMFSIPAAHVVQLSQRSPSRAV